MTTITKTPTPTPTPTPVCDRPSSGISLLSGTMYGSKYLSIDNQNEYDAVITMRRAATPPESGSKVMSFYLQAHDEHTVRTIETGDYTLWYKLGDCWNSKEKQFSENRGAYRFEDVLNYSPDTDGYDAKIYGVSDGNAQTDTVPPDQV